MELQFKYLILGKLNVIDQAPSAATPESLRFNSQPRKHFYFFVIHILVSLMDVVKLYSAG